MNECKCSIEDVLEKSFSSRNFKDKKAIVDFGRPTPDLKISTLIKRCTRHFSNQFYNKFLWLTGCCKTNKLYCWPCLLFAKEKTIWNTTGFCDMNNLSKAGIRHGKESSSHLTATMSLKMFGQDRIENMLDSARNLSIIHFNEKVNENRQVLKCMIDVTCHLACQELAFRGNDESQSSLNRGNFIETLNLLKEYNPILKNYLNNSTVFSGFSSDIQNDLIASIAFVLSEEIRSELENADYVGLMLDETTDVSNKSQLSIIFRYVKNDVVVERFLEFVDVSLGRSAQSLFDFVIPMLEKENVFSKLVCQSYDGAAVMSGNSKGLQTKIRELIPHAHYIHCFAHKLNLVLSQSCSQIIPCSSFFKNLYSFVNFFNHSTKRAASLNEFIKKKIPTAAPTRWEYNGRVVQTIFELKGDLICFLDNILENEQNWDSEAVLQSRGLFNILKDKQFIILLYFFNEFFPQTDVLFQILQKKANDIQYCISQITKFKTNISKIVKNFEAFWRNIEERENLTNLKRTRSKLFTKEDFKNLLTEIGEKIISTLNDRFESLPYFKFMRLLDVTNYNNFSTKFPADLLVNLETSYPKFIDTSILKTELKVIFNDDNFKDKKNIQSILKFLVEFQLDSCFSEFFKLIKLVLTLPVTTASCERSFSCLKRIKTQLRNNCGQSRLSNLALISIEKELLKNLKCQSSFYDKIIKHFSMKNRRIELSYKS